MDEDRHVLLVPVRTGSGDTLVITTARTIAGERVGLAFTSVAALRGTLGPAQRWISLSAHALRAMLVDVDVAGVLVDALPAERRGEHAWSRSGSLPDGVRIPRSAGFSVRQVGRDLYAASRTSGGTTPGPAERAGRGGGTTPCSAAARSDYRTVRPLFPPGGSAPTSSSAHPR